MMARDSRKKTGASGQRALRVGEELRHALASVLARGEAREPVLSDRPLTVTEVKVSPDLRNATAYVVPLGGGETDEVLLALRRAGGFLRGRLAHEVDLRYMPKLHFEIDRSFEAADRIDALLRDLPHTDSE